jgi:hypothetical protein
VWCGVDAAPHQGLGQLASASVAFATVTACLRCPNLAHRGARIDRTSHTGTALPAWEPIWKCLAGAFFGCMCSGIYDRGGCIRRALGIATSGCSAVRERCAGSCQPAPQSACHSTLAARPDSRTDDEVLCSRIMGKFGGSLNRTLWRQDTGFAPSHNPF